MKHRKWLFGVVILLVFSFSALSVQAQEDAPPIDDEFVDALVMMAVNHDMMAGKNEAGDLWALREAVNDYYDDRIMSLGTFGDTADLKAKQQRLVGKLDDKIKKVQGVDLIEFFVDLFSESVDNQGGTQQNVAQRLQTISGSDDPPQYYFEVMEAMVMTDIELQVNLLLDIDIINTQPSLAPAIADSSGWSYNVPAITDSTSPISPSSSGGDDDSGGADFWGDASSGDDDSGIGGDSSAPIGDSSAPISGGDDGGNSVDSVLMYKPVRFVNTGFEPVTVVVETYDPPPGYEGEPIPTASTVVFPETNSSGLLNLPEGIYTFCYYWQLDEDYNNDDYFDYHHRTTGTFTLNEYSSDNPESANAVTLTPDSVVSNPNGKCGEAAPQSPGQNPSSLTPEEQANQGTHTYSIYIHAPDVEFFDGETNTEVINVVFSNGSVQIGVVGDTQYTYNWVSTNTYSGINPENGDLETYIFTMEGIEAHSTFFEADVTSICTRQD